MKSEIREMDEREKMQKELGKNKQKERMYEKQSDKILFKNDYNLKMSNFLLKMLDFL